MAEAYALKRALEDADFRSGLTGFFEQMSSEATVQCREALKKRPPEIESAIGYAGEAKAAEEAFNKLEDFTRAQLAQQ